MRLTILVWCAICCVFPLHGGERGMRGGSPDASFSFLPDIPPYPGNVILAHPADSSVTANVILKQAARARIIYGIEGRSEQMTEVFELKASESKEVILENLQADSSCFYRLVDADTGKSLHPGYCSGTFHTARSRESGFIFTVQADSHLDSGCDPELYVATMSNALACRPDFHIDLGDTFMTGKIPSREDALKQYVAQRYYFGLIGHAVPVFLALGNHDGEEVFRRGSEAADGLAVWSCRQRKQYFSNPVPGKFYSGNTGVHAHAGALQNYYAWEWGNALFVVLDPYWYSKDKKNGGGGWNMTLGKTQYDWLADVLGKSQAGFKFIFIHQLTGGVDKAGRGGVEAAGLYEWGGHGKDGKDTFASNRPGWAKPIHALLVENGVSAVFHGHDHFYARQELDGIVYQLVPQPAHTGEGSVGDAANYGYSVGSFLPGSGFLKVQVSGSTATVSYIRSGLPGERAEKSDSSYLINSKRK